MVLHLQASEVLSNVTPFWAVHVEKGLIQIGLCVHALYGKASGDSIPLLLSCWEFIHIHCSLNGEMLAEEASSDDILVVPVFVLPLLSVRNVVQVHGDRMYYTWTLCIVNTHLE